MREADRIRARRGAGQRGFTLLEMLVVLGIVSVLAAVAVPRFSGTAAVANTARVQSDLQVLNSAILLYQVENGQYPADVPSLKAYVLDIENVRPPKGTCHLRSGETIEVTDTAYALTADRTQATCQSHTLGEFGRKE